MNKVKSDKSKKKVNIIVSNDLDISRKNSIINNFNRKQSLDIIVLPQSKVQNFGKTADDDESVKSLNEQEQSGDDEYLAESEIDDDNNNDASDDEANYSDGGGDY